MQLKRTVPLTLLLLVCSISSLVRPCSAKQVEQFDGRVIRITDGDTLVVYHNGLQRKIRLNGIDSPEAAQPFGGRAKMYASQMAFGKDVTVIVLNKDRFGRAVGEVILQDGRNLSDALLSNGYAWWYRKYSKDPHRSTLESKARAMGLGLWSQAQPEPPWQFRAAARSSTKASLR